MKENNNFDMSLEDLRNRLLWRKINLKLTYNELAIMTNVSRGTLTQFINGYDRITAETFYKLVRWLYLKVEPFIIQQTYQNVTIFLQEVPDVQHKTTIHPQIVKPNNWLKD